MPGYVLIHNKSRLGVNSIRAVYCDHFSCKLRGLMFRRELQPNEGLLLVQGKNSRLDASIHMLFMWMDLAVIWIDTSLNVVDAKLARRWRPAYFPAKPARYVLELPVENLKCFNIGDVVVFER
jgi:uncharacterized membrane protein (UPF0127 family)